MATLLPESRPVGAPDPGAVDNRLSLDPNDPRWKKKLAGWEDGGRYPITIGGIALEMDQISPGEFEIVGGETETPGEESTPTEESEPTGGMMGTPNRAVRGMMADQGAAGGY
jgi:hypothetical protein